MTGLSDCPFCGAADPFIGGDDDDGWYITCARIDCFCSVGECYDGYAMPDHIFRTKEEATSAWNQRIQKVTDDMLDRALDAYWQFDLEDGVSPAIRATLEAALTTPSTQSVLEVEHAAQAMHVHDVMQNVTPVREWDELDEGVRINYRGNARAAIEAVEAVRALRQR